MVSLGDVGDSLWEDEPDNGRSINLNSGLWCLTDKLVTVKQGSTNLFCLPPGVNVDGLNISKCVYWVLKITGKKKKKFQQTFLSCPEFLCMPPNKLPSFCYGELPSKGRKISFTFTPFPMKIILCFTSHCPKYECFSLSALSIEQSPDGSYKSIPCSISWPFEKCYWILVRFPWLTLLVVT